MANCLIARISLTSSWREAAIRLMYKEQQVRTQVRCVGWVKDNQERPILFSYSSFYLAIMMQRESFYRFISLEDRLSPLRTAATAKTVSTPTDSTLL